MRNKIEIIDKILPKLIKSLERCDLCLRRCQVNRLKGQKGYCASGDLPVVYRYGPHHGEEPPLSGEHGSGTIFFSRCNMSCVYCQNYKFSQFDSGKALTSRDLGIIMLELEKKLCHNINLVSPTHFVPKILEALRFAYSNGLKIPVVYNTGGYDSLHIIRALKGIVDIYLPDMRYSQDRMAKKYSNAPYYVANNRRLIKEMYSQVGNLKLSRGIADKGLIARLLILPHNISGTIKTLEFINKKIGKDVYLSVMSQYYPAFKASQYEELKEKITSKDYYKVKETLEKLDFCNGWVQPFMGEFDKALAGDNLLPTF